MRIIELSARIVNLPLRREIKHASASRSHSENLFVRCRLADGTEGWGEGVPRLYVTGESAEGAIKQLQATPLGDQLGTPCESWEDVASLCDRFNPTVLGDDPRGHAANSLRCAVELSIVDAFGKLFGQPAREFIRVIGDKGRLFVAREEVRYSTTITAEGNRRERVSALKMRLYGFRQCKVKVGLAGTDDVNRLRRIRRWLGWRVDLRLDANEAWPANLARDRIEPLLPFNISCVEQPVAHEEIDSLSEIRRTLPVPIMLDESLTSPHDAGMAIKMSACDHFNIRLSKCGGFIRSLKLAEMASSAGLGYQLGCHPGESGVLSAAGRHWATSVLDNRYLEGSYDRHVLRRLPTREDITFGYGGRAPAIHRPGLGVSIIPEILAKMTTHQVSFPLG